MYARMFDCHMRRASQQKSGLPEPGNMESDHPPQAPSMNRRSRTSNQTEQALPNLAFGRACSSFLPVQHRNKSEWFRFAVTICLDSVFYQIVLAEVLSKVHYIYLARIPFIP